MMNRQEVVEKLQSKAVNHYNETSGWTKKIELDIAIDIINQLNYPKKPVIPRFVADWIEDNREALEEYVYSDVQIVLPRIQDDNPMHSWLNGKGIGIIVDCIREGYEVEKEKLYTVEIPDPNSNGDSRLYLAKNDEGKVLIHIFQGYTSIEFADALKDEVNTRLTEAEIKQDFEWAWQFAKEEEK